MGVRIFGARVCRQKPDGGDRQVSEPFAFLAVCAFGLSLLAIDMVGRVAPRQTDMSGGDPCLTHFAARCDLSPAAYARR